MNKTVNKNKSSRKLRNISIASAIVVCSTFSAGAQTANANLFTRGLARFGLNIRSLFTGGPQLRAHRYGTPDNGVVRNVYHPKYQIGSNNYQEQIKKYYTEGQPKYLFKNK